jgi:ABC-2 type transport system ATP-binding protein
MRRRIGFLPENPSFYDHLTAEELLVYFAGLCGVRRHDRMRRASAALDEVELGGERRMRLRAFSKGMIQRVGVAQAIVGDPEVLFFDEPMSGLDPLGRRHLRQLMLRLRDRGRTIFFSSHILSDAEALCSRVAILAGGKLVAQGRLRDLVAFERRGWELVVANLGEAAKTQLGTRVTSMTPLADDRYTLELPASESPEHVIHDLALQGVEVVSLTPLQATLEDYFVTMVGGARQRDTSGLRA